MSNLYRPSCKINDLKMSRKIAIYTTSRAIPHMATHSRPLFIVCVQTFLKHNFFVLGYKLSLANGKRRSVTSDVHLEEVQPEAL